MDILEYAHTTLLEATNKLLETIAEAEVSTLEGVLPRDADRAVRHLHAASRAVQRKGWSWNSDEALPLSVDSEGYTVVPADTIKASNFSVPNVTPRLGRLYDRVAHGFVMLTDVTADIVRFLPFEYLPEAARAAIFIRAGIEFQAATLGGDSLTKFTELQFNEALSLLREEEDDTDAPNALLDNQTAQSITGSRR